MVQLPGVEFSWMSAWKWSPGFTGSVTVVAGSGMSSYQAEYWVEVPLTGS